jgi:hypothetical protein
MDAAVEPKVQKRKTFRIRNFLSTLGPGLITGASDDAHPESAPIVRPVRS